MKTKRVAEIINPFKLILNCGSEDGIQTGDKFIVFGLTKPITDPETKEILEAAEIIRGRGIVIHLQKKICTIESYEKEEIQNKVVRRIQPFNVFSGTTEEITGEQRNKSFENPEIGDYARLME